MGLLNPQKPFFLEIVLVSKTKSFKSYNITEHLKNFEYSVVSEDGGALTYKMDVINPMESVEELFKEYLIHYYADIKAENQSWFPQILIQWGYGKEKEDGISKVHLATVSDLKYNFSSGKEKVLSLTAVGDASFADDYVQGFLKARWEGPEIEEVEGLHVGSGEWVKWAGWKQYEGDNLVFTDVIEKLLMQHMANHPRTEANLTQINWGVLEVKLRKLYNDYVKENHKAEKGGSSFIVLNRSKSTASKQAAFKILEYFGFQVNFTTKLELFKTGYYFVEFTKLGSDNPGLLKPHYFAKDQLTSQATKAVNKILQAENAKIMDQPLNLPVRKHIDFIPDDPEGFDNNEETTYKVITSPGEITMQGTPYTLGLAKSKHVTIRSGNGSEFGAIITKTYGENELKNAIQSRTKAAIESNKEYQEIVKREAKMDAEWTASAPIEKNYADMSRKERRDLQLQSGISKLVVSWDSPEGVPLKKTILELIEKINNVIDDPEKTLTMHTQSPPLFVGRGKGTLEQVWKQHVKGREDVTRITVTQRDKVGEKDYEDSDMKIFSYPQLNMEGVPFNTSRLTYGGDDSTVRFFDFTSDIAYMSQSLQGIASFLSMGNNADFLTHDRIEKSIFYFVKELTDNEKTIEDSELRKDIRDSVSMQEGNDTTPLVLNEKTLDFLKGLQSTIKSKEMTRIFRKATRDKKSDDVKSFKAFVLMLQHRAALSELFNLNGGKHTSSYQVIFGESEETFETNSNIAYTLKKDNIFSKFRKGEGFGQDKLAMIYASDYLRGYPTQVRVKSLGIPELDTVMDVSNLRSIVLDVHDLSKERITGVRNIHWISGVYRPFEIKHTVSPSEGYLTELSLLRHGLGTSPREDNNA